MSRSLARRATVVAAATGCLMAALGPATAATTPNPFPVTITTTGGNRQFNVTQADGQTQLDRLAFGTDLSELPFQVTVTDQGIPLAGNDYSVSATMSNMYYKPTADTTDYKTMIPSNDLGLRYEPNSLRALGLKLPVVPEIKLGGQLSCSRLNLSLLSVLLQDACAELLQPFAESGAVDTVTNGATQELTETQLAVDGVLDLAKLPLALTGVQEGGRFVTPAKFNADDPVSGDGATSKRMMAGTNRLIGDTLDATVARVDAALDRALTGVAILPKDGSPSLVAKSELLTALSQQASLASIVEKLRGASDEEQDEVDQILAGATGLVNDVTVNQLSVMSGTYFAKPILTVAPVTIRPGAYEGKLTVDFFQE